MHQPQQRLITLCKLWGVVKFFHPYLAYREIDWDGALLAAIPAVKAANDSAAFADAIASMLAVLGDPVTQIIMPHTDAPSHELRPFTAELREDGVLVVTTGDSVRIPAESVEDKLSGAKAVVFDLRFPSSSSSDTAEWQAYYLNTHLAKWLCASAIQAPGERSRLHIGFAPQGEFGSPSYRSMFATRDARRYGPSASARRIPSIFIVNQHAPLPETILALQDAGMAAVVAEDGWHGGNQVSKHGIELENGMRAELRLSELYRADGKAGVCANVMIPASVNEGDDPAREAAIALALDFAPPTPNWPLRPAVGCSKGDARYEGMIYPGLEHRLLALFRIHNVIDYFFPYKDLMDDNWDAVLAAFMPRFEAAADALEYNLAIAEMLTHTRDTHVSTRSPVLRSYFGEGEAAVAARWIENAAVITQLRDEDTARAAGIAIGDVILSVDGEPVEQRIARIGQYLTASTPQAHRHRILARLLDGAPDSEALLVLRGADGQEKTVRLIRRQPAKSQNPGLRDTDIVRWLNERIGYADLDRLEHAQVDAMFETLAKAKAIIFDMRGYPYGTAWSIAPRLTARRQPPAARFERPRVTAPLTTDDQVTWLPGRDMFMQNLPEAEGSLYTGLTVMLIDERSISQAEHTGLFLRAANGTVFIGSATNGANGDVTSFVLPGGIEVSFTGQAVKHPDGRQLQRIGLQPDIEVHPTIRGMREGRDEVLEAAIEYVEKALVAPSARM